MRQARAEAERKGRQGERTEEQLSEALAVLRQIEGELERVKESDDAETVATESEKLVAKLDKLGRELKVNVIEDEGQQIELPESEDEKRLFTKLKAESLYLCGDALLCLKRHKEALVHLDRVIEMRPNHIDALLARGELHMDLGDDKSAMSDFNEARILHDYNPIGPVRHWDPNNPDALFYAASLLRKTMKRISRDKQDLDDYFPSSSSSSSSSSSLNEASSSEPEARPPEHRDGGVSEGKEKH